MMPRWVHRAYARVFGYFWTECPLCGRMFGGHEWKHSMYVDETHGRAICPAHGADVFLDAPEGLRIRFLGSGE